MRGKPFVLHDTGNRPDEILGVVALSSPPVHEYAPPNPEMLDHFARGLTPDQKSALQRSEQVSVLDFDGPSVQAGQANRHALEVVQALTRATGGIIWDEQTREVFTPEALEARLSSWTGQLPDVSAHVTIHAYREGELLRLVTLGMAKFALPDVAVENVSSSDSRKMGEMVNLVCQRMVETGKLAERGIMRLDADELKHAGVRERAKTYPAEGATHKATLHLSWAQPDEGDAPNRLVEIVFPGSKQGLQTRQNEMLAGFFGVRDELVYADHDEELLAASRRAKVAVLKYKNRYASGPQPATRLMVKAPFKTATGGNEWMWVEVISWQGSTIRGVLQNVPYDVPGLKQGARVEVEESAIFDYIYTSSDGGQVGNETDALLVGR